VLTVQPLNTAHVATDEPVDRFWGRPALGRSVNALDGRCPDAEKSSFAPPEFRSQVVELLQTTKASLGANGFERHTEARR
jgi:hypothetical protein